MTRIYEVNIVKLDNPDCKVIELSGSIELSSTLELERILEKQIETGLEKLVINLKQVEYINSQGLSALLAIKNRLVDSGGGLIIIGADKRVHTAIELVGLDQVIGVYEDLAHALLQDDLLKNH